MPTDIVLDKTAFEVWLASQPDDRQYYQNDGRACPLACYLREHKQVPNAFVTRVDWRDNNTNVDFRISPLPVWAMNFIQRFDYDSHGDNRFARAILTTLSP